MSSKLINFAKFSSIRIGPIADVYMIDSDSYPDNTYLIGSSNNILMGQNHPSLMKLSKKFDFISIENNHLRIGGATPSGKIVSFCKKHNIANFEFLAHLPGTLGGILKMNAGLKEYEIFNNLISLRNRYGWLNKDEINHGYRHTEIQDVVFEALFNMEPIFDVSKIDMFKKMRSNQPKEPSAGSTFKNPKNDYAGRLIDVVGLKGKRIGDMAFSDIHANFLINLGNGTFNEALQLINLAQETIFEKEKVWLETEIIILNRS